MKTCPRAFTEAQAVLGPDRSLLRAFAPSSLSSFYLRRMMVKPWQRTDTVNGTVLRCRWAPALPARHQELSGLGTSVEGGHLIPGAGRHRFQVAEHLGRGAVGSTWMGGDRGGGSRGEKVEEPPRVFYEGDDQFPL